MVADPRRKNPAASARDSNAVAAETTVAAAVDSAPGDAATVSDRAVSVLATAEVPVARSSQRKSVLRSLQEKPAKPRRRASKAVSRSSRHVTIVATTAANRQANGAAVAAGVGVVAMKARRRLPSLQSNKQ